MSENMELSISVVISFKISIFVLADTAREQRVYGETLLWLALKLVSLY